MKSSNHKNRFRIDLTVSTGFTLVELIVVIAILAILAGIAVPAYSGYIEKAQDSTVISELDAILTAAQASNATVGKIIGIEVAPDGKTVFIFGDGPLASDFHENMQCFYEKTDASQGSSLGEANTFVDGQRYVVIIEKIPNWESSSFGKQVVREGTLSAPGATWHGEGWLSGWDSSYDNAIG